MRIAIEFDADELNLLREWHNVAADCAPKYLEAKDARLLERVRYAIETLAEAVQQHTAVELLRLRLDLAVAKEGERVWKGIQEKAGPL